MHNVFTGCTNRGLYEQCVYRVTLTEGPVCTMCLQGYTNRGACMHNVFTGLH